MTETKKKKQLLDENSDMYISEYDKNLSYDLLKDAVRDLKGVVLCGENSEKIEKSISRHATRVNTLDEAVAVAYKLASPGDVVILSPASASFDMFKNYREMARCFKDAVRKTFQLLQSV